MEDTGNMNAEFFEALALLEKERGLTAEYLIERISNAIVIAVKKDYEVEDDNVLVEIDPAKGKFTVSLVRDVVEEVEDPHTQVSVEQARQVRKTLNAGDRMTTPSRPRSSAASPPRLPSTSSVRACATPSATRCTPRCRASLTRSCPPSSTTWTKSAVWSA